MDLALNNLQRLICHKTQTTNQPMHKWDIMTCSLLDFLKANLHFPNCAGSGRVYCECYYSSIVAI